MNRNEEQIDAGAQQLVALIHANLTMPDLPVRLNRLVLDLGRPVSVEEVAAAGGWTVAEVQAELDRETWRGVDRDEHGRLAGMGLSLQPTAHAFTVDNKTVYTWCATDMLHLPEDLGAGVVESTCPATGTTIRVELTPTEVVRVDPLEAVVSKVRPTEAVADARAEVCEMGNFFSSREAAAEWLAAYPDGEVVSVAAEFEIARRARQQLGWTARSTSRPSCGS